MEEFGLRKGNSEICKEEEFQITKNAAAQTAELNKLRIEDQKLANEQSQINAGKLPYYVDNDGTQYFGNGHFAWTVDKDGIKSKPVAIKSKEEIKAEAEAEAERVKLENEEVIYQDAGPVVVKDANKGIKEKELSAAPNKLVSYNKLTSEEQKFVRETITIYWPGVDVSNFIIYKSGNKYKFVPISSTLKNY